MRERGLVPTLVLALLLLCSCAHGRLDSTSAPSTAAPAEDPLREGDAARRRARYDEALALYRTAIERDPRSVPAHLRYVSLLLEQGRRSDALAVYRRRAASVRATPADRTMHARLETDGSPAALRGTYLQAAQADPAEPWWRLAKAEVEIADADGWIARREAARARSDRKAASVARDEAGAALDRADAALVAANALAPQLAEVALFRGFAAAVRGDLEGRGVDRVTRYEEARAAFRVAARRDAELGAAWEGLGDVHARLGDHEESLAALLKAAELHPADAHLRLAVGVQLQRTDRHAHAARQYAQAARLAPGDAEPWLRLGDAYAEDERWDEALDAYNEALRREATAAEVMLRQGVAFEHLGRRDEARTSYERYLHHGGERETTARRRIERLLRDETVEGRP